MATIPPNKLTPSTIASYLMPALAQDNLNYLIMQATDIFQEQSKHFIFAGVGFSALGTSYSAIYNPTNQWILYASSCAICLGTAYHQGWLEQALFHAQMELEKVKKSLNLAETALSDRELLLVDLGSTKEKLKEVSDVVITAGINEKNLLKELATTREKQKELSDIAIQLTTILTFFQNLKETYPDPKLFLEHLASIEKVTKVTQLHLAKTDLEMASKFTDLKTFLEKLNKQDLDKMALLIEMSKDITVIKKGVATANNSLEELKNQKAEVA